MASRLPHALADLLRRRDPHCYRGPSVANHPMLGGRKDLRPHRLGDRLRHDHFMDGGVDRRGGGRRVVLAAWATAAAADRI